MVLINIIFLNIDCFNRSLKYLKKEGFNHLKLDSDFFLYPILQYQIP